MSSGHPWTGHSLGGRQSALCPHSAASFCLPPISKSTIPSPGPSTDPHPTSLTSPHPLLTGPQLPVHLQLAAGPIGAQIRGCLAGVGEQVWTGLERDVDVEGGRLVVTHNPFRHQDPSASHERVSDGPGCLRAVAGYKHPAALRVNFQHFVGNGDVWEVNKSGKERNQDGLSTLKLWFDNSSKS